MPDWFGKKCKHQIIERYETTPDNMMPDIIICNHGGNLICDKNNCCEKFCPIDYKRLMNSN